MDRERARELLPIIEAFAEGKMIEWRSPTNAPNVWTSGTDELVFFDSYEYRIKPEPREFWLDLSDYEVWVDQEKPPVPHAIKVREVLE